MVGVQSSTFLSVYQNSFFLDFCSLKMPKTTWNLPEIGWKGPNKIAEITWRGLNLLHKKGWAFAPKNILDNFGVSLERSQTSSELLETPWTSQNFSVAIRERSISPKFPCIKFFCDPLGHGHPRLRVKDARANNLILLCSERWGEGFWAGMSARISARTSAGYPAQKLYV